MVENDEINDDMTTKFMIREAIYIANGLEAEYIRELAEHPELMDKLATTKQASKELLWGFGVWMPKIIAPFALKGIVDALEALRKELKKVRKTKDLESNRVLRIIDRVSHLIKWIVDKIYKAP